MAVVAISALANQTRASASEYTERSMLWLSGRNLGGRIFTELAWKVYAIQWKFTAMVYYIAICGSFARSLRHQSNVGCGC